MSKDTKELAEILTMVSTFVLIIIKTTVNMIREKDRIRVESQYLLGISDLDKLNQTLGEEK